MGSIANEAVFRTYPFLRRFSHEPSVERFGVEQVTSDIFDSQCLTYRNEYYYLLDKPGNILISIGTRSIPRCWGKPWTWLGYQKIDGESVSQALHRLLDRIDEAVYVMKIDSFDVTLYVTLDNLTLREWAEQQIAGNQIALKARP